MIVASLICAAALSQQPTGLGDGFVQAANKGKAPFKDFLKIHLLNYSDAFAERLEGFREQACPIVYKRSGFRSSSMEKHLICDKAGQDLTLTLNLTSGALPKIESLFINGPEGIDQGPPKDYSGWRNLAALVDDLRRDTGVPAAGVCVIQKGKEPEVAVSGIRRFGQEARVTPEEVWQMGSIGKSMTATLIARLVEKGVLKWETTIGQALPDLAMKPGYKNVTLAQLLRHRGGIPQDMGFTQPQVIRIAGGEKEPRKLRMNYMKDVLSRDLISAPGAKFAYSNAGYTLAGVIAEEATGQSFEALMKQEVFAPLGMTTAVVGRTGLPQDRPFGHVHGEKDPQPREIDGSLGDMLAPAGGISCSLKDLARFGEAHMKGLEGGSAFLKQATFAELHRGIAENGGGQVYACGWSIESLPGTALRHGHNGSNGTFVAELAFFPAEGLVVASAVNQGGEGEPSPPLQAVLAIARKLAPRKQ